MNCPPAVSVRCMRNRKISVNSHSPIMNSFEIHKYPRTPHIEGSRLQPGDEDLSQISFSEIAGKHLVNEEKCDGANSAISFDET